MLSVRRGSIVFQSAFTLLLSLHKAKICRGSALVVTIAEAVPDSPHLRLLRSWTVNHRVSLILEYYIASKSDDEQLRAGSLLLDDRRRGR